MQLRTFVFIVALPITAYGAYRLKKNLKDSEQQSHGLANSLPQKVKRMVAE